jgi:phenylpyruvate tautomerase PptA (4-oxalocrotonate tautomerase family)
MQHLFEETNVMNLNDDSDETVDGGLSRRTVLMAATVAAGALTTATQALADSAPAANFGEPFVELYVPPGVLSLEQRGDMISGITDVVLRATNRPPVDPARRLFVSIIETAEGGFGVNGHVFVPAKKSG